MCRVLSLLQKILKFQLLAIFLLIFRLSPWKNLQFWLGSFHIWHKSSLASEGVSHVNDPWPWPIFSRSFGLDLENRVRSVIYIIKRNFRHKKSHYWIDQFSWLSCKKFVKLTTKSMYTFAYFELFDIYVSRLIEFKFYWRTYDFVTF